MKLVGQGKTFFNIQDFNSAVIIAFIQDFNSAVIMLAIIFTLKRQRAYKYCRSSRRDRGSTDPCYIYTKEFM